MRVLRRHSEGADLASILLKEHWPSHSHKRFPFCALHCLMRITEAMFMMITQRCLKNDKVIGRLNEGLTQAGIAKQFTKIPGASGVHTYEKLTFEGHQALRLLATDDNGKMWVARIMESMWPNGDAEGEGGRKYVPRSVALWQQWAKVVEIMKERDPAKRAFGGGWAPVSLQMVIHTCDGRLCQRSESKQRRWSAGRKSSVSTLIPSPVLQLCIIAMGKSISAVSER